MYAEVTVVIFNNIFPPINIYFKAANCKTSTSLSVLSLIEFSYNICHCVC